MSSFKYAPSCINHQQTNNGDGAFLKDDKIILKAVPCLRGEFPLCLRLLSETMAWDNPRKSTWTRSGRRKNAKLRTVDVVRKTFWRGENSIITNNCFHAFVLFTQRPLGSPLTPNISKNIECGWGYTIPPDKMLVLFAEDESDHEYHSAVFSVAVNSPNRYLVSEWNEMIQSKHVQ